MSVSLPHSLLCSLLIGSPAASHASPASNAGGQQLSYDYDILREGSTVGFHSVRIQSDEEHTRVISRSRIEIGWLGLTLYRFEYEAEEVWDGQGLRRLVSRADDDGERLEISGNRHNDRFQWAVNDAEPVNHAMPIFPTNHWNSGVLSQTWVLNTLTGSINRVFILPYPEGKPILDLSSGEIRQYRYDGELQLDAWYDDSGHWLGMRFEGRDGSTIEYRCRNCPPRRAL